jgi:hypothetical protein
MHPAQGNDVRILDIARHLEGIETEWHRLGTVWAHQIGIAREQMDTAINSLTVEFAGIVDGLDAVAVLARDMEAEETRLRQGASPDESAVVSVLENNTARLEREALRIRANVESSLVHLQFQDRVNQILGHVESNIHALPNALAQIRDTFVQSGQLRPLDFTPLLAAIEASYTTAEERGSPADGENAEDDLTFF